MKRSGFLRVNLRDFLRGLLLSLISAILTYLIDLLSSESTDINFKKIGLICVVTLISYLKLQLFTDNTNTTKQDELTTEPNETN